MKRFLYVNGIYLILLITGIHISHTSCSRQLHPNNSFPNIDSSSEKKQLQKFLAGGTEKKITTHNTSADEIISTAKKYLGVPHCMGGATKRCMDCSGLLVKVFSEHGIQLPHNSEEQARFGKIVQKKGDLKKGDLVFFTRSYKTSRFITHSGIFVGGNKFIHTSSSNGVTVTSLDNSWWKEKFVFGTSVFNNR